MNIAQVAHIISQQLIPTDRPNALEQTTFEFELAESVYHLFLTPLLTHSPADALNLDEQETKLMQGALVAIKLQQKSPALFAVTPPAVGCSMPHEIYLKAIFHEERDTLKLRILVEDEEPESTVFHPVRLRVLLNSALAA